MVYVDDMQANYGRMIMCHMIADSTEELLLMADAIEVPRKWIQKVGTYAEHFDICLTKKRMAIAHGAVQITAKELGRKLRERRIGLQTTLAIPHSKRIVDWNELGMDPNY